jgi:DeoR family transcriptional regulator of aga operon
MTKVEERRKAIKELLLTKEYINVEELALLMNVTGATIRKDLRDMESRHEVYRNHGNVSLRRPRIIDLNINEKIFINADEKKSIAKAAAAMIGKNDTILMTSGSTIEAMAREIRSGSNLNVVTTSIGVALELARNENIDIMILGGRLVRNSLSVRDGYSIQGLENVSCTKLFFSCDGLDLNTGVITAFVEEARMTAAMMKVATKKILLADSSKFGKFGLGKICEISQVDTIITDSGISYTMRQKIEKAGVHVIIS